MAQGKEGRQEQALRSGSIGLIGLATLGAVMMSPALGLYGQWGPMAAIIGKPTPLVFIAALIISLPTAISYALVSREMPSAGSAFTWVGRWASWSVGAWVGLVMVAYYTIAVILQPIVFGLYFQDLLSIFGVDAGLLGWAIGVLAATVLVAFLCYRGIESSTRSAVAFILVEIGVVVALIVTIVVVRGPSGALSLEPFNPTQINGGAAAFWAAMILGVLSFTGFDVISTVAEEAEAPRRLLPQATVLSMLAVGAFWVVSSWILSASEPVARVVELSQSGLTAMTPLAADYWGWGRILVIITALSAAAAVYVATVIGASRSLYAMGRQGVLPRSLGRLHPQYRVPWNAMHVVFGTSLLGVFIVTMIFANPLETFVWWAGSVAFFALITYIAVNLSNMVYFWRFARERFNWFLNGVVPAVAILLDGYLIYQSFFRSLWSAGFRTGQSVILVSLVLLLLALAYVLYARNKGGRFPVRGESEAPEPDTVNR